MHKDKTRLYNELEGNIECGRSNENTIIRRLDWTGVC